MEEKGALHWLLILVLLACCKRIKGFVRLQSTMTNKMHQHIYYASKVIASELMRALPTERNIFLNQRTIYEHIEILGPMDLYGPFVASHKNYFLVYLPNTETWKITFIVFHTQYVFHHKSKLINVLVCIGANSVPWVNRTVLWWVMTEGVGLEISFRQ